MKRMDLPSGVDQYIHESIEYSLGLPVSSQTLASKLLASEEACRVLQEQIFLMHDKLKEKDKKIERTRAEASMNAQALRKCIEENQKLSAQCEDLSNQCTRWEKECALFERDREALMEFGNDADERAKVAEVRVFEAENDLGRLSKELEHCKHECEMHEMKEARATEELLLLRQRIDSLKHSSQFYPRDGNKELLHSPAVRPDDLPIVNTLEEAHILEPLISSILVKVNSTGRFKNEVVANPHSILEAHIGQEPCEKLWTSLRPLTKDILALAAEAELLQKEKEHLRFNLHMAEEEVKVLFEENKLLNKENKKLLRKYTRGNIHSGSEDCDRTTHSSGKGKRKTSPNAINSVDSTIESCGSDSPRKPLSPLQQNSPNPRRRKN